MPRALPARATRPRRSRAPARALRFLRVGRDRARRAVPRRRAERSVVGHRGARARSARAVRDRRRRALRLRPQHPGARPRTPRATASRSICSTSTRSRAAPIEQEFERETHREARSLRCSRATAAIPAPPAPRDAAAARAARAARRARASRTTSPTSTRSSTSRRWTGPGCSTTSRARWRRCELSIVAVSRARRARAAAIDSFYVTERGRAEAHTIRGASARSRYGDPGRDRAGRRHEARRRDRRLPRASRRRARPVAGDDRGVRPRSRGARAARSATSRSRSIDAATLRAHVERLAHARARRLDARTLALGDLRACSPGCARSACSRTIRWPISSGPSRAARYRRCYPTRRSIALVRAPDESDAGHPRPRAARAALRRRPARLGGDEAAARRDLQLASRSLTVLGKGRRQRLALVGEPAVRCARALPRGGPAALGARRRRAPRSSSPRAARA